MRELTGVHKDIKELARLFPGIDIDGGIELADRISENDEEAKSTLRSILGKKPKRPLYYVDHEMSVLPEHGRRSSIKYMADYIDQLARFTLEDFKPLSRLKKRALGQTVTKLKKYLDKDLLKRLSVYNHTYTIAKHDFNITIDKTTFNVRDVVFYTYCTASLRDELLKISPTAREYNESGDAFYRYNPKD